MEIIKPSNQFISDCRLSAEATAYNLSQKIRPGEPLTPDVMICKFTRGDISECHFKLRDKDRTPTSHVPEAGISVLIPSSLDCQSNVAVILGKESDMEGNMYCIFAGELPQDWNSYYDPTSNIPNHATLVHNSYAGTHPLEASNPPRPAREVAADTFRSGEVFKRNPTQRT